MALAGLIAASCFYANDWNSFYQQRTQLSAGWGSGDGFFTAVVPGTNRFAWFYGDTYFPDNGEPNDFRSNTILVQAHTPISTPPGSGEYVFYARAATGTPPGPESINSVTPSAPLPPPNHTARDYASPLTDLGFAWLWPNDAITLKNASNQDRLIMFWRRMSCASQHVARTLASPGCPGGPYDFELRGIEIHEIQNPGSGSPGWLYPSSGGKTELWDADGCAGGCSPALPAGGENGIEWGVSLLTHLSYVYIYGITPGSGGLDAVVARIPTSDASNAIKNYENWRFLRASAQEPPGSGDWKADLKASEMKRIAVGVTAEFSVHRVNWTGPGGNHARFLMVHGQAPGVGSTEATIRRTAIDDPAVIFQEVDSFGANEGMNTVHRVSKAHGHIVNQPDSSSYYFLISHWQPIDGVWYFGLVESVWYSVHFLQPWCTTNCWG